MALAAAAGAAPLEVYGRLPSLEDAALSPDGSSIAFVRTTQEQRLVVVYSLKEHRFLGGVRVGAHKLRSIAWADDNQLLQTTSSTGTPSGLSGSQSEWFPIEDHDVRTHRSRALLEAVRDLRTMNVVWSTPMVRREGADTVVYLHRFFINDRATPGLFKVNLSTGVERAARLGTTDAIGWLVDDKGQVVVEEDYCEQDRRWSFKVARGGNLQEAASGIDAIDRPHMLGFDPTGQAVVVPLIENDEVVWKPLSLSGGRWGEAFAPGRPHDAVVVDAYSQRIIGPMPKADEPRYEFFDPELQERSDWALRQYRDERVELVSLDKEDHWLSRSATRL